MTIREQLAAARSIANGTAKRTSVAPYEPMRPKIEEMDIRSKLNVARGIAQGAAKYKPSSVSMPKGTDPSALALAARRNEAAVRQTEARKEQERRSAPASVADPPLLTALPGWTADKKKTGLDVDLVGETFKVLKDPANQGVNFAEAQAKAEKNIMGRNGGRSRGFGLSPEAVKGVIARARGGGEHSFYQAFEDKKAQRPLSTTQQMEQTLKTFSIGETMALQRARKEASETQRLAQLDLGAAKQELAALETERKRMEAELEEAWKRKSDAQNAVSLYDYEDNDAYLAALESAGGDEATEMSYRLDELKRTIDEKATELTNAKYVQLSLLPTRDDFQVYAARGGGMKNNVAKAVKEKKVRIEGGRFWDPKTDYAADDLIYSKMTDDEARIYNYLLAKDNERGTSYADEYLELMAEPMRARIGREQADFIKKSGPVLRPRLTALYGLGSGLDRGVTGIIQNFSDTPLPASALQYGAGYVREDLENVGPKILGSSLGQIGFDLASTTGNMAPSIGAGMVGGPWAAAGVTFLSSGGNAYGEALAQGYSKGEARAYGILAGASEAGLQYALSGISALGGKVVHSQGIQAALNNIERAALRIPAKYAVAAAGEMTEEYLQEILTPIFRNLALGEDNEFKLFTEDAAYAALLAALSVGVLEGPNIVSTDIKLDKLGKELRGKLGDDTLSVTRLLVELGMKTKEGSDAYKAALAAKKQLDSRGTVNDVTLGTLHHDVMGAVLGEGTKSTSTVGKENTHEIEAQNFRQAIDAWDGKSKIAFDVGRTSDVLQSLGVKDQKIRLQSDKVNGILQKHPGMTKELIKLAPDILAYPVLVAKSKTHETRIVVFGEVFDANGAPVLAALELQPTTKGGEVVDVINLSSLYGKDKNPADF